MLAGTPVLLLREGTERAEGKDAQRENIRAARALAESIRSTLGPKGMDKMLVDSAGDVVITNDGATIVQEMEIQHPAAKMLAELAKSQDLECGDGTKTSVILAGELLHKAEELLEEHIHPTVITQGYRLAAQRAIEQLREVGRPVHRGDRDLLRRIAMTSMISKGVASYREQLADLAVGAVEAVLEEHEGRFTFDKRNVQIVRRTGGDISHSELLEGHILELEVAHSAMPRTVAPAHLALLAGAVEVRKTELSAEIRITAPDQMQSFLSEEERLVAEMVDSVRRTGANVLVAEKGIDDLAAEHFARAGIYAVRRAKRADLELLAKATGAEIVSRPEELRSSDLGTAARVEERHIGEDRLTFVTGCEGARSVSLLLRGGSEHVLAEVERSLVDALSTVGGAIEDGLVVTGAGAAAIELSLRLRDLAARIGGREQIAVERFADALEVIPSTLAENAGMSTLDALIELRRRHASGERDAGVDVLNARIADMREVAVEPIRVGRQAIQGATEAAAMILRIDDVIASRRAPGPASSAGPHAGAPG